MRFRILPLRFFHKKSHSYCLNETQKAGFWGHIFFLMYGSFGAIFSKNNRGNPWVNPRQLYEFHENWFKTDSCIVRLIRFEKISRGDSHKRN